MCSRNYRISFKQAQLSFQRQRGKAGIAKDRARQLLRKIIYTFEALPTETN